MELVRIIIISLELDAFFAVQPTGSFQNFRNQFNPVSRAICLVGKQRPHYKHIHRLMRKIRTYD